MEESLNIGLELGLPEQVVEQVQFEESPTLHRNYKEKKEDKFSQPTNHFKSGLPTGKPHPTAKVTESLCLPLKPSSFAIKNSRRLDLKKKRMRNSDKKQTKKGATLEFKKSLSIQIKKKKLNASINTNNTHEEKKSEDTGNTDQPTKDTDGGKQLLTIKALPVFEGLKIKKKKFQNKPGDGTKQLSKSYSEMGVGLVGIKGIKIKRKHLNPRAINKKSVHDEI